MLCRFRELSEDRYPLTLRLPARVDSDSDISDEELQAAVMRLQVSTDRTRPHRGPIVQLSGLDMPSLQACLSSLH